MDVPQLHTLVQCTVFQVSTCCDADFPFGGRLVSHLSTKRKEEFLVILTQQPSSDQPPQVSISLLLSVNDI